MTPAALEEARRLFEANGFVSAGRVLTDAELAELEERIAGVCAGTIPVPEESVRAHAGMAWKDAAGGVHPEAVWQLFDVHRHDAALGRLCELPAIRASCAALLGGPPRLWSTQAMLKPARHGGAIPWHQDSSYWGDVPRLTCWIAIDDATPANGCMRMIPGSHRLGQLPYEPTAIEGAPVKLLVTRDVPADRQVYVPVPAGCASIHHARTVHASDRNETPRARRAIAVTFEREA